MGMMLVNRNLRITSLAAVLACAALSARADDNAPDGVTYSKDVAPILNQRCGECHRPGQIGPMSLLNFEEARPWAKSIKKSITDRTMPPWFADPQYGHFKDAMVMTPEEIATVVKWVDAGAPEGNKADLPPEPEFARIEWRMGKPDMIFEMTEAYTVPDDVEDIYQHFIIPSGLTEDKWVTATELLPGATDAVHHILVFLAPAGKVDKSKLDELAEEEDGDFEEGTDEEAGLMGSGLFAKYGPGSNPEIWHSGRGRKMPAGCNIVFQVHYHKQPGPGTAKVDLSKLAVKFADGPVEHPITTAWIAHPSFVIPAGSPDHKAESVFKFIDDGQIYALTPHLHLRGKSFTYTAEYPDGSTAILLDVPKWNFNWQISYVLQEPLDIPKGTKIRATAHWDNSTNNPHNPDPTLEIRWGNPSTDEMMIGFMDYSYNRLKKHQSQFGMPEDMNLFSFGGNGGGEGRTEEEKTKWRERMEERRNKNSGESKETSATAGE